MTLGAPVNVQLRRTSSTSLEVTWDPPPHSSSTTSAIGQYHQASISGYRIYYSPYANYDLDHWLSMDLFVAHTTAELQSLEPHTTYAVQVRAKSADGRYGNLSEVVVSNKLEHGMYEVWT